LAYDPAVALTLRRYEGNIPLSTLAFRAGERLAPGQLRVRATISYQACNGRVCLAPAEKVMEMPVEVTGSDSKRQEVYGWKTW
jgi:hypothetical protein